MSRYQLLRSGRKSGMILAFLAGASVLGVGVFVGAALVQNSYEKVLQSGTDE